MTAAAGAGSPAGRWLVAAIVAATAIIAALPPGVLLRRRPRPAEGTVARLAQPLWVSGESADAAVSRSPGAAAAMHVSPPSKGASASPVIRHCVIDDARQTPAWVELDDVHETRALADQPQRRRRAAPPPGDAAWSRSTVIVADPVEARPHWGVVGPTNRGGKFDSGEPRSG